jgi:hypothetical protein
MNVFFIATYVVLDIENICWHDADSFTVSVGCALLLIGSVYVDEKVYKDQFIDRIRKQHQLQNLVRVKMIFNRLSSLSKG